VRLPKITKLIIVLFFSYSGLWAQQYHSFHKQEWLAHRMLPKKTSLFKNWAIPIRPLNNFRNNAPNITIFGYLPDWQYKNSRKYLQYDVLTHIAAFDFQVSADGMISNPSYWPWSDVINKAHDNGVKVILAAVNFDSDEIHHLLTDSAAKNNFFNQLKNKISAYRLDGVNVDFEGLKTADRGDLLNSFMRDLTLYLHKQVSGSEVSFAAPAVNWGGWNLGGLAEACDYLFIMGYSFYGKWSSTSGPVAPLDGGKYNVTNTVKVQYGGIDGKKLILGAPYYGQRWQTQSNVSYAAAQNYVGSVKFNAGAKAGFNYGWHWDGVSQTPWYAYQIGSDWYEGWCDDVRSLGLKYDLAEAYQYRGVGMWALGYDDGSSKLWNELRCRYAPGTLPLPDRPQGIVVRSFAPDTVYFHIASQDFTDGFFVYFGTDGTHFPDSLYCPTNEGLLPGFVPDSLYFFKFRAQNKRGFSPFSSMLAVCGSSGLAQALIVDGFDRNSNNHNTFDFIRAHAFALHAQGISLASAQNEALISEAVDLNDYTLCDWFLGEESTEDFTFNAKEQQIIEEYLTAGGRLFSSGSEIGWDLVAYGSAADRSFYRNYLKAEYIADAPLNTKGKYYQVQAPSAGLFYGIPSFWFDNGSHGSYNVNWPDAIISGDGGVLALKYAGISTANGGCAVSYQGIFGCGSEPGKLVYLSIPFETIYPEQIRRQLMAKIIEFFNNSTPLGSFPALQPLNFTLEQNYPNPFNPATVISYTVGAIRESSVQVQLTIYNASGQKIRTVVDRRQIAGRYSVVFNAGNLAAGLYFYRLQVRGAKEGFSQTRKMILLR